MKDKWESLDGQINVKWFLTAASTLTNPCWCFIPPRTHKALSRVVCHKSVRWLPRWRFTLKAARWLISSIASESWACSSEGRPHPQSLIACLSVSPQCFEWNWHCHQTAIHKHSQTSVGWDIAACWGTLTNTLVWKTPARTAEWIIHSCVTCRGSKINVKRSPHGEAHVGGRNPS